MPSSSIFRPAVLSDGCMLAYLPKPAVIAHRGASAHAPENTLPAFELAFSQGADAVECDVQLTADQQVIVLHDRTLDRTTNVTGPVKHFSLDELSRVDAAAGYHPAYQEVRIPTLGDVLRELSDDEQVNIELKGYDRPWGLLSEKVVDLVQGNNARNRVLLSSFNPFSILAAHHHCPEIDKGFIIQGIPLLIGLQLGISTLLPIDSVHLSGNFLNKNIIQRIHKMGKKAFFFTLNHPEEINQAVHLGADGFFTDDPSLARRILHRQSQYI